MKQASLALFLASAAAFAGCTGSRQAPPPEPLQPAADTSRMPDRPVREASVTPEPAPAPAPIAAADIAPPTKVPVKPAPPSPAPTPAPAASDPAVAHLDGHVITREQLLKPLIEGYGLNMLLNIVQLEYVKQVAAEKHVEVTSADVDHEREATFAKLFKDADKADYPQLYAQLLQQQHISRAEFELVLNTNAYLRKIAEPLVSAAITEDALEEGFRQLYGETVQVRHIELSNMQEVLEAKRRLANGDSFTKVAQEMSRNPYTGPLGGELPPFSRSAAYPQALKDTAFSLKEGEVSDAVEANGHFHLVQLEQRIAPKVVKFEDVKESVREELMESGVQQYIQQLRVQYAQAAVKLLQVDDPVLKKQYEDKLTQRDQQIQGRNEIREQFERERQRILDRSTTKPADMLPAAPATDQPAAEPSNTSSAPQAPASEVAQPPATPSGAATPGTPD